MTESLVFHLLILILTTEFSDVRAFQLSSDPPIPYPSGRSQMKEPFPIKKLSNQVKDSPGRQITRVKTVAVICHENYIEIAIKVDLFDVGLPVDASELRLGADSQFIPSCKVTAFSNNEYIIAAELTDCGTQHWITDDSLIYTNLLIFTPQPSPDGVVRLEQAVVPIECYYSRKFDVTSNPIKPTWIPYSSTQSAVEDLQFSLKLMTRWEQEKTVGPLAIFPKKSKMGFLAPPRVKEGVPPLPSLSKDKKPMPHSSLWKNGVTAEMDQVGGVTPPPSLEPTEQPNIMESEPESKKLEEEEEDDE
ncbi:zona pellucida sperm-binding protein 3-like isoform X1 [Megalobrama amblycephala]|uniref:zona pellucida sperm-binding protein 3-like isoform X1 n=1 Tax=Megalobrama amblycephala TaxID=75352 RepID=UPI0020143597|nr:zona pellucida sperm-binding protein 3-like isoform X1 [Megalobrama amblycephala]